MTTASQIANEQELLLHAWECVFSDRKIVYLSGPLTTGRRFVQWYSDYGRTAAGNMRRYRKLHERDVVSPNAADLRETADRLRSKLGRPILSPESVRVAHWEQEHYIALWERVIEKFADLVILLDGWQYSAGSAYEAYFAFSHGVDVITPDGVKIDLDTAARLLNDVCRVISKKKVPIDIATPARLIAQLAGVRRDHIEFGRDHSGRKDKVLFDLGEHANIAQFVSFSRERGTLAQEYIRIAGIPTDYKFGTPVEAVDYLIHHNVEGTVNIRTFSLDNIRSRPFEYGLRSARDVVALAEAYAQKGLNIIVNETIDIHDGGVSGVIMGNVIEFAPDDLPRTVEKPGVCSLPRNLGLDLLATVYGFSPKLNVPYLSRVEFSLHPRKRGLRNDHTILWEYTGISDGSVTPSFVWPNRFSHLVGDKVFGLLVGQLIGLKIPKSNVISRRVAPFLFGTPTGENEVWLRTCPREQVPGKYTTTHSWIDPFALLNSEDPSNSIIASIISQESVGAEYSGALIVESDGAVTIEGIAGWGDRLMKGEVEREELPSIVRDRILETYETAHKILGPVRFEWVFDGSELWVVQLHKGATTSYADWIVPGSAKRWITFNATLGAPNLLEELRELLAHLEEDTGLIVQGKIGMTSHIADTIRRAGVPARVSN